MDEKVNDQMNTLLKQQENLLASSEKILQLLTDRSLLNVDAALNDRKVAIIYAYRYLLNREPESPEVVKEMMDGWMGGWGELREAFLESQEYRIQNPIIDMPYRSLQVENIIYFYNCLDRVIPEGMRFTGVNWAKQDIDNFINIADQIFYKNKVDAPPRTGIFLDIGGNIGTTSIYCNLKLKPELHFIAFEPVQENATLFTINSIINGVRNNIKVEVIALSNEVSNSRVIVSTSENMGGNFVAEMDQVEDLKKAGRIIEKIPEITLDKYLEKNQISGDQIKYIWLDVEGYEPEVLEGATRLLREHRIPSCVEFNQGYYKTCHKYEKMLNLLKNYFDYFVVCQHAAKGEATPRPIIEIEELLEEFNHESCDLILF